MPLLIDGSMTLYDLELAALRIDADAGRDSPLMTATELIETLSRYIHPRGYSGRGMSRPLGLRSE